MQAYPHNLENMASTLGTSSLLAPAPDPTGAITWLWIVAAVAGNAFAAYWLFKALSTQLPALKHLGAALLLRFRDWNRRPRPTQGEDAQVCISTHTVLQGSTHGTTVKSRATWPPANSVQAPPLATRSAAGDSSKTSVQSAIEVVDAALAARRISHGMHSTLQHEGNVPQPQSSISSSAGVAVTHEDTPAFAAVKRLYTGGYTNYQGVPQGGTSLEWRNLHFSVPVKSGAGHKLLLQGVCGSVHSSQLLAIMGPSGAGKSTLLEMLAMRRSAARSTGDGALQSSLLLDGTPATQDRLKEASSYIPQEDALLPQMTVGEVLALHAALRLPGSMSAEQRQARQDAVLEAMGLTRQSDTLVGGELPGGLLLRGLSGGERKRLALSAGLLQGPRLLFADEPTSGLDAFAALTVMAHLSTMAQGPYACAVVVTIHQPRAAIWDMIDKVLLLAQGHMMFEGSTHHLQRWFTEQLPPMLGLPAHTPPFQYSPEQHGSISDWAMDLVSLSDAALLTAITASKQGVDAEVQQEVQQGLHLEENQAQLLQIQCHEGSVVANPEVAVSAEQLSRCSSSSNRASSMRLTWVVAAAGHFLAHYLQRRCRRVSGVDKGTAHTDCETAVHPSSSTVEHERTAAVHSHQDSKGGIGCAGAGCDSWEEREEELACSWASASEDQVQSAPTSPVADPAAGNATQGSAPASSAAVAGSVVHDHSLASAEFGTGTKDCPAVIPHPVPFTSPHAVSQGIVAQDKADAAASPSMQRVSAPAAGCDPWTHARSTMAAAWSNSHRAVSKWWRECRALIWREAVSATRNPTDVAGRMLTFVWVAMLGNFLLYGGGYMGDNAGSIRTRYVWLYFVLFFYLVMPFLFMSVFSADKRFYLADVAAGLYRPGPYYVAKLVASLPINLLISTAYVLTAYGMFGFRHDALSVIQTTAVCAVFSLVCLQWIFFAMAVSPNQDIAFILSVAFAVVSLLINSMFIGPMESPGWPWVGKLRYISPMDYGWQALMTAEMHDRYFDCSGTDQGALGLDALGLYLQFIPPTPSLSFLRGGLKTERYDCVVSGNIVLHYFGVIPKVWQHFLALLAYLAVLHVATFAALSWATYRATTGKKGNVVVG